MILGKEQRKYKETKRSKNKERENPANSNAQTTSGEWKNQKSPCGSQAPREREGWGTKN
jgi:hypothetical protein